MIAIKTQASMLYIYKIHTCAVLAVISSANNKGVGVSNNFNRSKSINTFTAL
jgi:hypothetical protein